MPQTPEWIAQRRSVTAPFIIVNPKVYLTGSDLIELAALVDEFAQRYRLSALFTAPHADLHGVAAATTSLTITAQHMDPIRPGRGMGKILPESLAANGADAVVVNHAEHPMTLAEVDVAILRAREVGLLSVVCADSDRQCDALARLNPDIMICETTANIGAGAMDESEYAARTTRLVKEIDPTILVIQAAGVSNGRDVTRVLTAGADGTGGTTGILHAPDRAAVLDDLFGSAAAFRDGGGGR